MRVRALILVIKAGLQPALLCRPDTPRPPRLALLCTCTLARNTGLSSPASLPWRGGKVASNAPLG